VTAPREQLTPATPGPHGVAATHVGVANLANGLTVARLAMVPLFFALFIAAGHHDTGLRLVATAVFVIASLTDRVDGEIARRRSLVTDFGKIADPIADKALTGAALIALSLVGDVAWWVTLVILARELGVTMLRFWVIRRGVIAASRGGKVKTVVQAFAIGFYLLPIHGVWGTLRWWLMGVAIVITLATGLDYVMRAVRLRRATR
jgi:CDP-diacylglycerol---glycerol-3-phosphate 3-phosphatidyltransferase